MKIRYLLLTAMAAVLFTACEPAATNTNTARNANASNANANANANQQAAAPAPTKDELMALERSAYEAFRTKNAGFWDPFLSSNFTGYGQTGRLDKAAALKEYAGTGCDIKSFTLTDDQMTLLAPDVAAVSYKTAGDGTCGGQKIPAEQWAGGLYVRENGKWKGAFHAEAPVFDPKAPASPSKVATQPGAPAASPAATDTDATTDAIVAAETKIWEAWKNKDAAAMEGALGKDFTFVSGMGRWDRGQTMKMWVTESKCDVKSYSITEPQTTALANNIILLTFKGAGQGTCDGQPIQTEWYGVAYMNDAGTWKPVWGMSVPLA